MNSSQPHQRARRRERRRVSEPSVPAPEQPAVPLKEMVLLRKTTGHRSHTFRIDSTLCPMSSKVAETLAVLGADEGERALLDPVVGYKSKAYLMDKMNVTEEALDSRIRRARDFFNRLQRDGVADRNLTRALIVNDRKLGFRLLINRPGVNTGNPI